MTLVGCDPASNRLLVADPNARGTYWVAWDTFMASWRTLRGAVAVIPA